MALFMIDMGTEKDNLYFDAKDKKDAQAKADDYYRRNKSSKRGDLKQISMTKMASAQEFKAALRAEQIASKFAKSK